MGLKRPTLLEYGLEPLIPTLGAFYQPVEPIWCDRPKSAPPIISVGYIRLGKAGIFEGFFARASSLVTGPDDDVHILARTAENG